MYFINYLIKLFILLMKRLNFNKYINKNFYFQKKELDLKKKYEFDLLEEKFAYKEGGFSLVKGEGLKVRIRQDFIKKDLNFGNEDFKKNIRSNSFKKVLDPFYVPKVRFFPENRELGSVKKQSFFPNKQFYPLNGNYKPSRWWLDFLRKEGISSSNRRLNLKKKFLSFRPDIIEQSAFLYDLKKHLKFKDIFKTRKKLRCKILNGKVLKKVVELSLPFKKNKNYNKKILNRFPKSFRNCLFTKKCYIKLKKYYKFLKENPRYFKNNRYFRNLENFFNFGGNSIGFKKRVSKIKNNYSNKKLKFLKKTARPKIKFLEKNSKLFMDKNNFGSSLLNFKSNNFQSFNKVKIVAVQKKFVMVCVLCFNFIYL